MPTTITNTDLIDRRPHSRRPRHLRRLAVTLALATGTLLATAAAPAAAEGRTGYYTAPECGWHPQAKTSALMAGSYDYKISMVALPQVTGTTATPQTVWAYVEFKQSNRTYRSGWFYTTSAVANRWTTSWTSQSGQTGIRAVTDLPGESGYVNASPNTLVQVSLYWLTGASTTGSLGVWAHAANDTVNHLVCNAGQPS